MTRRPSSANFSIFGPTNSSGMSVFNMITAQIKASNCVVRTILPGCQKGIFSWSKISSALRKANLLAAPAPVLALRFWSKSRLPSVTWRSSIFTGREPSKGREVSPSSLTFWGSSFGRPSESTVSSVEKGDGTPETEIGLGCFT